MLGQPWQPSFWLGRNLRFVKFRRGFFKSLDVGGNPLSTVFPTRWQNR